MLKNARMFQYIITLPQSEYQIGILYQNILKPEKYASYRTEIALQNKNNCQKEIPSIQKGYLEYLQEIHRKNMPLLYYQWDNSCHS